MKVTCESCGSKYTIKDDKVRGKRVKIRCKGCKSPIVVDGIALDGSPLNGSGGVSDSENAPAYSDVPDAPDDAGSLGVERWSVNLSETDSRDMTTEEIVAAWNSGIVTDDAYIYKPGFDDWKPILDVPELAQLLLSSPAEAADAFSPPVGKSPFAASPVRAPRAAVSGRKGDLFGAVATAGGEDDLGMAAAPPMVLPSMEGRPTGARNESSVLFSLDALKAGFESAAPAPTAPSRNDDPFGLSAAPSLSLGGGFDTNNALFAAPPPEPKKPKKVSLAPSGAPAAAEATGLDRNKLLMIAGAVVLLLVLVGGVGFALGGSSSDKADSAETAGLEKEKAKADDAREGSSDKAAAKDEAADKKDSAADKQPEAEKKDAAAEGDKPAEAAVKPEADKPTDAAAPAAPGTKAGTASTTDSKTATTTKTTKPAAPAGDSTAPPFNKSAAISALSSAAGSAAGCKIPGGPSGSGKAIVTFAPSGRVTTANVVGGKFGGTSVGGCVASRFRGARVPAFSGSAVTVSKSFTIQ
jgi:predicted Zn finger-like uncharacterized protein